MLAAAVLFAACDDKDNKYDFEEELSRSGKVSLVASIESMDTKMSMPSTGHGRWEEGDKIAVACSDGSFVTFDLEGTGGTVRAKFTGEIPAGLTLGTVAVWPAEMAGRAGEDDVTLRFPSEYAESVKTLNIPMVASIGDDWNIEFKQVASYVSFSVKELPAETMSLTVSGAGKNLSGDLVQKVSKLGSEGVETSLGDKGIHYTLTASSKKAVFDVPVPSADYDSLVVTAYNAENEALTTQTMRRSISLSRGGRPALAYTMEAPPVVVELPCVEVCGVKWAKGNLAYDAAGGDAIFREGWKLAPEQWYYYHYNQRDAFNKTSKPYSGKPLRADVASSATAYDHFNWFGIEDSYSNDGAAYAIPKPESDLSGMMFSDQVCEVKVADFEKAKFGDVAYWATKGLYRTPTVEEMNALYEKASVKYGHCVVPDPDHESGNIKVWGFLFTNPAGERVREVEADNEISLTELETGVFFPLAGRRAASTTTQIIHTRLQGQYWASQATTSSGFAHILMFNFALGAEKCVHLGEAQVINPGFNNATGFCIRPVVN